MILRKIEWIHIVDERNAIYVWILSFERGGGCQEDKGMCFKIMYTFYDLSQYTAH